MKLKSAVRGLYDTVRSPAIRASAIAFMRKYSDADRAVTHFACRSRDADAISAFLASAGCGTDDFAVVRSGLDPESASVRIFRTGNTDALVRALSSVPASHYDRMYATVAHPDAESAAAPFPDSVEDAPDVPAPVSHFVLKLRDRSDEILAAVAALDPDDHETFVNPKSRHLANATACVRAARGWAARMAGNPERPYLLPLPVLEAYYRCASPKGTADGSPLVFFAGPLMAQEVRLARRDERVPAVALAQAPLVEYRYPSSSARGSELDGYFCNSVAQLEGADLSNKDGLVAVCDAPLAFARDGLYGFDDVVTPLCSAARKLPLWKYVQGIYKGCYGDLVGTGFPTQGMRIAISDNSETWAPSLGFPASSRSGDNRRRKVSKDDESAIAKYTVFVTDLAMDASYTLIDRFVNENRTVPAIVRESPAGAPDFTGTALSKEETAWEWFAMTHLWDAFGSDNAWDNGWNRPPAEHDPLGADENFANYRKWKAAQDCSSLTALSRASNPAFSAGRSDGDLEFTDVSAFADGALMLALRLHAENGNLPFSAWRGPGPELHGENTVVANVYSGIWTDLSPEIGENNPDGVFQKFRTYPMTDSISAAAGPDKDRNALSGWLAVMAGNGIQQVRFAQRTKGTPRFASLVVETNVHAVKFLAGAARMSGGLPTLEKRLKRAFADNILLRRTNPYGVTDEEIGHMPPYTGHHDAMLMAYGPQRCAASLSNAAYAGLNYGSVDVGYRVDSYGRMTLVFTVCGDDFAYARMAYRWSRSMPLATAHVQAKLYVPGSRTVTVAEGDMGKFGSAVAFMHAVHALRMPSDYSGSGDACGGAIGPMHREPFSGVPAGFSPSRSWFLGFESVKLESALSR